MLQASGCKLGPIGPANIFKSCNGKTQTPEQTMDQNKVRAKYKPKII